MEAKSNNSKKKYTFFSIIIFIIYIYSKVRDPYYLFNFFNLNKTKRINIDSVYIICDKDNEERINNINIIKKNIRPKLFLFDGIFPNKKNWFDIYNKYSEKYLLLKNNDLRAHGCFLSHILLLEKLLLSDYKYVLILEDNINIIKNIPNTISVPKDFSILSLEEERLGGIFYNLDFVRVTEGCGACGYIINIESIKTILNKLKVTNLPIDLAYISLSRNNDIKMYISKEKYLKRSTLKTTRNRYK